MPGYDDYPVKVGSSNDLNHTWTRYPTFDTHTSSEIPLPPEKPFPGRNRIPQTVAHFITSGDPSIRLPPPTTINRNDEVSPAFTC
ncbi:hypothetical protein R6Q59_033909 [Mikania micrantha]